MSGITDLWPHLRRLAFPPFQRYGFSAAVFLTVGNNFAPQNSERLPSMCNRTTHDHKPTGTRHRT
jgi:hypothetical protein